MSARRASCTLSLRRARFLGMNCPKACCSCSCICSMPGRFIIGAPPASWTSISTIRSSSLPLSRSCFIDARPSSLPPGSRASRSFASAPALARSATAAFRSSSTIATDAATRSRTIESTSRPTYPTSVNLVASTLRNGAWASFASRRAISVLPTPVGPIIRMFLGATSARIASGSLRRRRWLRSATATARFALCWPMMWRSSASTTSRGVRSNGVVGFMRAPSGFRSARRCRARRSRARPRGRPRPRAARRRA